MESIFGKHWINQGTMSKFYNIPVNTTSLIYKLGKKNKVPIIYVYAERLSKSKGFDIHLDAINKEFYDLDEVGAADLLNKTIVYLKEIDYDKIQLNKKQFSNAHLFIHQKPRRKNIIGNMRGAEDRLWINVARGMRKFLESPFKKYKK